MHVVATAGHVDHGKSTLVRALTGIEPDRWEDERRRGLTIDLGYAWTTLPEVGEVAFVDVPGHRRFIGNMLAGLGPAPAVLLVVAADSGWSAQSEEHLRAVNALGLEHGLVVVTRADLVDAARAEEVRRDVVDRVAQSSLGEAEAVVVSAVSGAGLDDLRAGLAALCRRLPPPRADGRLRLWVDRSFTIKGSGTVVTGTLGAGSIAAGDQVEVSGRGGPRRLSVRRLQALERQRDSVGAVARVAVNVRGVESGEIHRGDALLTPGAWRHADDVDVRLSAEVDDPPQQVICHVGTASVAARLRPLAAAAARLRLERPLPLETGDRLILRDPGREGAIIGATVVDTAPPALTRRGDGSRRGLEVMDTAEVTLLDEVGRRGVLTLDDARLLGHAPDTFSDAELSAAGVERLGSHLVTREQADTWVARLTAAVDAQATADPLEPSLAMAAARAAAGVPDLSMLEQLCAAGGLVVDRGRVSRPGVRPSLGAKQEGLDRIIRRLGADPFAAPEQPDLDAAGLGTREVAAAVTTGQLLRLVSSGGDIVLLLPTSPARAMRVLAGLPQPFTTSAARQALGTTRRVAIPLLEHLDARGWTRRLDAGHREVMR